MAPFAQNMREVRLVEQGKRETTNVDSQSLEAQFEARIDGEWAVLVVPNGGYLLGLLIQASTMFQEGSPLSEPLYLSAQFLGSTSVGPCTIVVNKIKSGKSYVNLTAKLVQKGRINIHCQLIYGKLSVAQHPYGAFPATRNQLTLAHPSGLSRRCPLSVHPSKCSTTPFGPPFQFGKRLVQAIDPYYIDKMERIAALPYVSDSDGGDLGGGIFEWGGWYQMLDEEDVITPQVVCFLGDVAPWMLPQSILAKREAPMWVPTLAFSVDFKYHVPTASEDVPGISKRTIGIFFTSKFLIDGRHDVTAEIWTAPSEIGRGHEEPGWQDKMFCMGLVNQTVTCVPAAMNLKNSTSKL